MRACVCDVLTVSFSDHINCKVSLIADIKGDVVKVHVGSAQSYRHYGFVAAVEKGEEGASSGSPGEGRAVP